MFVLYYPIFLLCIFLVPIFFRNFASYQFNKSYHRIKNALIMSIDKAMYPQNCHILGKAVRLIIFSIIKQLFSIHYC